MVRPASPRSSGWPTWAPTCPRTYQRWSSIPRLKAWLALSEINALLTGDIVPVSGLHTGWAVMKGVNAAIGGKVWLKAPVAWAGGKDIRPLAASCDYRDKDGNGCGRVMFSSYHTYGESAELLPQERLLEYLILEIGACAVLQWLRNLRESEPWARASWACGVGVRRGRGRGRVPICRARNGSARADQHT